MQNTLEIILDSIGQKDLEVKKTWRLNERHYGGLTGLNKAETAAKHGEEQVKIWRRSFDVPPPTMEKDHPYYDTIVNDPRYFEQQILYTVQSDPQVLDPGWVDLDLGSSPD